MVLKKNQIEELDLAKSELMSFAAHKLKTPLIPIISYISMMLRDDKNLTKFQKKELNVVLKNANRLNDLVTNILELYNLELNISDLNYEKISLNSLITESINYMKVFAKIKDIKLSKDIKKNIFFYGDKDKLKKVLVLLIDNGIKYNKKGRVKIITNSNKKEVIIKVSDNGIGIAKKDLEKLFKKYSRITNKLNETVKGAGISLLLAKKIVEKHNGLIWVESKYLKGSDFFFSIPLKKSQK